MGAGHCGLHARPSSYAGIIRVRFQGRGPAASSQRLLPWVVLHNSTSTGGFVKEFCLFLRIWIVPHCPCWVTMPSGTYDHPGNA